MNTSQEHTTPFTILISALGGEGGGVLMNWLVECARDSGLPVQATSVPGVAQRTGSTSYYIEIGRPGITPVFNLVPMPGRVDVVVASELMEAARMLQLGYVSPDRTVLITSSSRTYSTAEKITMAEGRYDPDVIQDAMVKLAKDVHVHDLEKIATDNATYISATLFGAAAASGALPWSLESSRQLLAAQRGAEASLRGFDAAVSEIIGHDGESVTDSVNSTGDESPNAPAASSVEAQQAEFSSELASIMALGEQRMIDYQDHDYANLYKTRVNRLSALCDANDTAQQEVLCHAAKRLATWMAYEDIARVADLKTRPQRYLKIRSECEADTDQLVRITEFLKPRAEELADQLPLKQGLWLRQRCKMGKGLPFLGKGRRVRSNSAWGYWLLRAAAWTKCYRPRSLRYHEEQQAIEQWLDAMAVALPASLTYAKVLADLPRVRKGYSDTLQRGLAAYKVLFDTYVNPAVKAGAFEAYASDFEDALAAAFKDEHHTALNETVVRFHPSVNSPVLP